MLPAINLQAKATDKTNVTASSNAKEYDLVVIGGTPAGIAVAIAAGRAGKTVIMISMSEKAANFGRTIDFGLRIHVVVRDTEDQTRAAADRLISQLDRDKGQEIKHRSQDSKSAGVKWQDALREKAGDDLYIEENVWSGIGLARSGCASAIIGDPDQVLAKLNRYMDMGIRAFILSGYPYQEECDRFAKYVLPHLPTAQLNQVPQRLVDDPITPLTTGPRK